MTTVVPGGTEIPSEEIRSLPEFRVGDPIVGSTLALRRNPLTTLVEPYRRFGRIFRMRLLGRSVVVVAGVDADEFVWRDADQWSWGGSGTLFRDQFGPDHLLRLDGADHAARRRRLEAAFRPRPVKAQVPTMADVWFDALASSAGTVIDLRDLCYRLVVQMSGRAVLGVDLPEGVEDDVARVDRDGSSKASLGSLRRALVGPARRARRQELTRLVADVVGRRRRDWSGDDLVSEILRGLPHGAAIPPVDALVADAMLLLRAGADATAHQVLWTLLLMGSRPDWIAALRDELDGLTVAAAADIRAFPKLHATLVEAERLRPVIPAAIRVAAKGLSFSSRTIPAGTTVLHATTLTHFLDELHHDPMAFRPERFLPPDVEVRTPHGLGTYGGGAHACLGQPLARAQVALAVAIVTKHADLTPVEPVSLRARLDGVVTPVERHLPTRLTLRM